MKTVNKAKLPKIIILIVLALTVALSGGAGIYFTTQYNSYKKSYTESMEKVDSFTFHFNGKNADKLKENPIIQGKILIADNFRKEYQAKADAEKAQMNKYKTFFVIFYIVCGLMIVCFIAVAFGKVNFSKTKSSKKAKATADDTPVEIADDKENSAKDDKSKSDFDDIEEILNSIKK